MPSGIDLLLLLWMSILVYNSVHMCNTQCKILYIHQLYNFPWKTYATSCIGCEKRLAVWQYCNYRQYAAYTRKSITVIIHRWSHCTGLLNGDNIEQELVDWWDVPKERMTSGGVGMTSNWALNRMLWICSFANCLARMLSIDLSPRATNWPKSSSD